MLSIPFKKSFCTPKLLPFSDTDTLKLQYLLCIYVLVTVEVIVLVSEPVLCKYFMPLLEV